MDHDLKPIPPGITILEQMQLRNMTREDLADMLNASVKEINDLIKGDIQIDDKIANQLYEIFKIPTSFWINLQSIYTEKLREYEKRNK